MREIIELCKETILQRCEEICDHLSQEKWYLNLQSQIIEKRKVISSHLCNTCSIELNNYDDLRLELTNKIIEEVYLQAFKDALSLTKILTPYLTPYSKF